MTQKFRNFLLLLAMSIFLILVLGSHFVWIGMIGLLLTVANVSYVLFGLSNNYSKNESSAGFCNGSSIKKESKCLLSVISGKIKTKEKFQKIKHFYSNRLNTLPKKISFWLLVVISFVFLLPFYIGIIFIYIISKVKMENIWVGIGLMLS